MSIAALLVVVLAGGVAAAVVDDDGHPRPAHDSVDVGFLQDMIDHHEQAVLLSLITLRQQPSPAVRDAAVDVIASQREEIGTMEGWLTMWGYERGQPSRPVMAWMGMPTDLDAMPGLARPEEVAALAAADGPAVDALFLDLMIVHHEGGIHMAEHASRHVGRAHVRFLASQMARNQRAEIRHMRTIEEAMAAAAPPD